MSDVDPVGEGRLMTFNVGRGATGPQGTDQADLRRVAEVLAAGGGPDVVCLQEVHSADVPLLCATLRHDHGHDLHAHFTPTVPAAQMVRSLTAARVVATSGAPPTSSTDRATSASPSCHGPR